MQINSGDTAWVLASAALVLLMTPGLAFFYAGMVRPKNIISVLLQNFVTMALVSVLWVIVGFSIAFGPDSGHGLFGNLHFAGLGNLVGAVIPGYVNNLAQTIPPLAFVAFQLMFAIITPALITGAIAERMKFTPFVLFIVLWAVFVYAPIAHWVFSPIGWLFKEGALDFAGGTVVHVNSGAAALAVALVLGRRLGWPNVTDPSRTNVPFLLLGAGMLWFGWFGFNAGSALAANGLATTAFINTNTAAAAGLLGWLFMERFRGALAASSEHGRRRGEGGKATALGAGSGVVAGLVAITPAAGFVNPVGSIAIGLLAGLICCLTCNLKFRYKVDDALDVVGIHLVAGVVGALAIGLFATKTVNAAGRDGIIYGGNWDLLADQAVAVLAVGAYSFAATYIISAALNSLLGLRVSEDDEITGLDVALHQETAVDLGPVFGDFGMSSDEDAYGQDDANGAREFTTSGSHAAVGGQDYYDGPLYQYAPPEYNPMHYYGRPISYRGRPVGFPRPPGPGSRRRYPPPPR